MTTGSFHENSGVYIIVYDPTIDIVTPLRKPRKEVYRISNDINTYSHQIGAVGGYLDASIEVVTTFIDLNDWIDNGLGRDIKVFNEANIVIWEGFINQISITIGGLSIDIGPLMDICNRASVNYSRILDNTVYPPVVGMQQPTTIAENTTSQARYGIIEKILSGGTCTIEDAERYRDTYLADAAYPKPNETFTSGGGSAPVLSLGCLGYVNWLNAYTFDSTTLGTATISTRVQTILAADPNGVISTDYSYLNANAYLTTAQEQGDQTAWTVLQSLIALGDATDARWLFGIYNNRVAKYYQATTSIEYMHRIGDKTQDLQTQNGVIVRPWDIKPGKWAFFPDLLIGKPYDSVATATDPRYLFIESVRYTAPYTFELTGSRVGNVGQLMAKMGLGGMA